MLFQKPVVDVERHVEMRYRRVFPISLEGSIKASYEEALKKLKEATELERQSYQLTMEKSILENRMSIWDWLGKNFSSLSVALTSGDYENAKILVEEIQKEILKRYQDERDLLNKVNAGQSVLSNVPTVQIVQTTSYTGSSPTFMIRTPSTSPSTQQVLTSTSQSPENTILKELESKAKQTGTTYVAMNPQGGYLVITPQGGYSTTTPEKLIQQLQVPQQTPQKSYTSLFSPASYPAFNPFQQSGFYNPFR